MKKDKNDGLIMMMLLGFVYFMIWWFKGVESIKPEKQKKDDKNK